MKNKIFKYCLILFVVGVIVSLLLSFVNELTKPIIEKQRLENVKESLIKVDSNNNWETGDLYFDFNEYESIIDVYVSLDEDKKIHYVCFLNETYGYSNGKITTLVFIDNNKKTIKSVEIIDLEGQTKGVGSLIVDDPNYVKGYEEEDVNKYYNKNHNFESGSKEIITGATVSSRAVIEAVVNSCNVYINRG